MSRYAWDQMADESAAEYQRFLAYVSLGPSRSIDKAYRHYCKRLAGADEVGVRAKTAPGNWQQNAVRYRWKDRAQAWDVAKIRAYGNRVVLLWVHGLEVLAEKGLAAARRYKPGDDAWADVLNTFRTVAAHLTPEGVRAVAESTRQPADDSPPVERDRESVK